MKPPRVLVLGSVNIDLVVRGERLPSPGETVTGGEFFQAFGGKGANQAVAAARLSRFPVQFIGAVGDDAHGREARAALAHENLSLDHLQTIPDVATGIALICVDAAGQNSISVASGANARLLPGTIGALPDSVFEEAGVLLASLEVPLATVRAALVRAREQGLVTVLNPAPASLELLDAKILSLVDVLIPNEHEAALLVGAPIDGIESAIVTGKALRQLGAARVVVTLGANGCAVVDEVGVACHIPAIPVCAADTTAAGDAFCGALAVALAEGNELLTASKWAGRAAAISVTRSGAQPSLPSRAEVDARVI